MIKKKKKAIYINIVFICRCCSSISTDGDDTKRRKRRKKQKTWKRIISILEYLGGFTVVLSLCISVKILISIKRKTSRITGEVEKIRHIKEQKEQEIGYYLFKVSRVFTGSK